MNRRAFLTGCAVGAARPLLADTQLVYGGFPMGVQTFCFNDRPFDQMLDAVVASGAKGIELFHGHTAPEDIRRDNQKLRAWRRSVDIKHFQRLRERVEAARLKILTFDISMRSDWSDSEIERAFQMAQALGVAQMTSSSNVSVTPRLDTFAAKYRIRVGLHNHAESKPDELATAADFHSALQGRSSWLGITFDTGHFAAAGFDCVPFVKEFRSRVIAYHCKDRRKNFGEQVPLGTGDAQLPNLITYLRKNYSGIPILVEHVVKQGDRLAAIRNDVAWLRRELSKES